MTNNPYNLKEMTDLELYKWIAGWKPSTAQYIAGQQEIHRRNESGSAKRSRINLCLAGLALVVAIVALFV